MVKSCVSPLPVHHLLRNRFNVLFDSTQAALQLKLKSFILILDRYEQISIV